MISATTIQTIGGFLEFVGLVTVAWGIFETGGDSANAPASSSPDNAREGRRHDEFAVSAAVGVD